MGARLEDYERAAPYKSFIHVDQFAGPQQLAEYLHILDKDDTKYNEYFQVTVYNRELNNTGCPIDIDIDC
jgi:Glycosyltransferase family 10 (fucosyltransferase) C-term